MSSEGLVELGDEVDDGDDEEVVEDEEEELGEEDGDVDDDDTLDCWEASKAFEDLPGGRVHKK